MSEVVKEHPRGTILAVHLQPKARKTEIVGVHGGALKIKVAAPPVEGRANRVLLEFLAKRLKIGKKDLTILSGEKARDKRILITGKSPEEVRRALL
ncbi:DUF167 domain-containing protein [Thermosulfurimonas sp. F29]|uniref:DUF167 domain-containing protein n=1 Tax=Thermosulfurimonas sp. F29 TaxID=2867247 RepID=UPI001C829E0D|nr:DUF167 domain-containing protein [Thermosulfurimonas sp. F29]